METNDKQRTSTYYVAGLARYVLVQASSPDEARDKGEEELGRSAITVRNATREEIDLQAVHDRMLWESRLVPNYRALSGTGWRVGSGVQIAKGVYASEGHGVYVALDEELADLFHRGPGSSKFKVRFSLRRACEAIGDVVVGELHATDLLEQPEVPSDPDWIKANKRAFLLTMKRGWDEVAFNRHLTHVLKQMGFDGVYVSSGWEWVVVFDPSRVEILEERC
jgi:hypothetical protein